MKFMVMIKGNKDYEAGIPPKPELMEAIGRHTAEMMQAGVVLETGGLLPSFRGAKVHLSKGAFSVTDGPFAEAKELIGGYAIIRANSKEEVIQHTRHFLQIHADVLGPSYEAEAEIREMFDPAEPGPCVPCGSQGDR